MTSLRYAGLLLAGLAGMAGCRRPVPPADTGFVTIWTRTAYGLARAERLNPPAASRVFAYAAIALYEGWAAFSDSLRSLAGQVNGLDSLPRPARGKRYDPASVAVESQTTVLNGLLAGGFTTTATEIAELHDSLIGARRRQGVSERVLENSRSYGTELGQALLDWARKDGFLETRGRDFKMPQGPQYWVPTATPAQFRSRSSSAVQEYITLDNPAGSERVTELDDRSLMLNRPKRLGMSLTPGIDPTKPVEPYWGELRPFAIPDANSCPAAPPVPFSTAPGSPFYQQAMAVYETGKNLTEEQRAIAEFWADNPGESGTPAGHWMGIISRFAEQHHLSPERAVEAYALVAMGTADALIACWHLKYQLNLIRPYTYIHRYIDPNWHTAIITPPFPEYASGHAIQSRASAEILTALFGDETPFEDATHVALGHPIRRYRSFREAAAQVAMARLYGGMHYPMGNENGAEQGRCIGETIIRRIHTRKQ
jgi:hypothetical protein